MLFSSLQYTHQPFVVMFSMTEQEAGTSEQTYGDFIGGHKNIQVRTVSVFSMIIFLWLGLWVSRCIMVVGRKASCILYPLLAHVLEVVGFY